MQWLDKVLKFWRKLFTTNAFKGKYKTIGKKKLIKVMKSNKWQIIDIRKEVVYLEHHLENTWNIPADIFTLKSLSKLDRNKKIVILNDDYRSDTAIYKKLKRFNFKPYIFYGGYKSIRNEESFDDFTIVNVI